MNSEIMKALGFTQEVEDMENNRCPFCKLTVRSTDFVDDASRREYEISGLCSQCQDEVFSSNDSENEYLDELDYDMYAGGSFYDPDDNLY